MTIEYTWNIIELERNSINGGVIVVHWDCVGLDEDTNNSARVYSSSSLGVADPTDPEFIPFENLTKTQVLQWLWQILDKEEIESSVTSQIELLNNPEKLLGVPW
jgi:hypothetical protein